MQSILVVDDEPSMRSFIDNALSGEFDVMCANNGREAQSLLTANNYDLVITDLVMPEMNGIDLLIKILKDKPTQKIIAISGGGGINGRFDYLPVAKLIGANNIMRKPFDLGELRKTVRALINSDID